MVDAWTVVGIVAEPASMSMSDCKTADNTTFVHNSTTFKEAVNCSGREITSSKMLNLKLNSLITSVMPNDNGLESSGCTFFRNIGLLVHGNDQDINSAQDVRMTPHPRG
jgi:hypothetical protein